MNDLVPRDDGPFIRRVEDPGAVELAPRIVHELRGRCFDLPPDVYRLQAELLAFRLLGPHAVRAPEADLVVASEIDRYIAKHLNGDREWQKSIRDRMAMRLGVALFDLVFGKMFQKSLPE